MRRFKLDAQLLLASKEVKLNIELIEELLSQGANINYFDSYENSVFHNLCYNKGMKLEFLKLCVETYGANFNKVGKDKRTALHALCYNPKAPLDCIKFAIENGANVNVLDRFENTPFHYICITRDKDLLGFLEFFVEGYNNIFNVVNKFRENMFFYLCKNSSIAIKELEFALKNGADIDWKNVYNNTPFHMICSNPKISIKLLQFFLERGASFKSECRDKRKPSDRLLENQRLTAPILEFAIDNGLSLNRGNKQDYNNKISFDCVKLVILRGLKIRVPNNNVVHKFEDFMQMAEVYLLTNKQYDAKLRKPFAEIKGYNSKEIIKFCALQNFHITLPSVKFYFSSDKMPILCSFGLDEKGDAILKSSKNISEATFQELEQYLYMKPSNYNRHVLESITIWHPINTVRTLCSMKDYDDFDKKAMCMMLIRNSKGCVLNKVPKVLIIKILSIHLLDELERVCSL